MKKQDDPDKSRVRVERATHADVECLTELLGVLFGIERDFRRDPQRQRAGLRLLLTRERDAVVFVARDDHRAVGMVSAQLVVSTAEGALSVWIEDVIVEDVMRGRGIGRMLLDAVLDWARSAGATRAQLLIDTENDSAEAFYARLGWQKTQLAARRLLLSRR